MQQAAERPGAGASRRRPPPLRWTRCCSGARCRCSDSRPRPTRPRSTRATPTWRPSTRKHGPTSAPPSRQHRSWFVTLAGQPDEGHHGAAEDAAQVLRRERQRYAVAEERRASHILIKADKAADRGRPPRRPRTAAQLRKSRPVRRAGEEELGPRPGAEGGDLDFFGRGAMVKATSRTPSSR